MAEKFWRYDEERRFGEFSTHSKHQRQEKQRKAPSNLLDNSEQMDRGIMPQR